MCGIVGVLSRRKNPPGSFVPMLELMAHRGPDGVGEWNGELPGGGSIWLGHRRLSILDLSGSAGQPMWDTSGTVALVFNGEIYNYIELREELVRAGVSFKTMSDSEVLLEAYKAWGEGCLDRLNGMFAFAIWDTRRKRLFAARDRFGEKPFLFAQKKDFLAFASEFKALLALPQLSLDHDDLALLRFGSDQGMDGGRQTAFDDIVQLMPGEALVLNAHVGFDVKIWRWYEVKPRTCPSDETEADTFCEFRDLLFDSVKLRMRSDVPVGSCLSGGLDSSAIVCIARRLLGREANYNTFTGVFPGTYADEASYAKHVVDANSTSAHIVEPSAARFIEEAGQFIWMNELPVGSASQFAQWCVFALAKQAGVTVLLDGQGADEILGGYEQYFRDYVQSLRETRQHERLMRELPLIRERYPLALIPASRSLRDRIPFRIRQFAAKKFGAGSSFLFGLRPETAELIRHQTARTRLPGRNQLASTLQQDSFGRFLTTLLRYGDRNSMAHSREVRLPFCDHRIIEFALGLGPERLMGDVQTKRLLRESMRGILPELIRTRWNKQGFRPPQDLWFAEPSFLAFVRDTLSSRYVQNNPHYLPHAWDKMLDRIEAGALRLGWTIWQPLLIELWRTHFVERIRTVRSSMQVAA